MSPDAPRPAGEGGEPPPEYRIYRTRPKFLGDRVDAAGVKPAPTGTPVRPRKRTVPPHPGARRVLVWLLRALAFWILLSGVLFLFSAQLLQDRVDQATRDQLGSGGAPIVGASTILVLDVKVDRVLRHTQSVSLKTRWRDLSGGDSFDWSQPPKRTRMRTSNSQKTPQALRVPKGRGIVVLETGSDSGAAWVLGWIESDVVSEHALNRRHVAHVGPPRRFPERRSPEGLCAMNERLGHVDDNRNFGATPVKGHLIDHVRIGRDVAEPVDTQRFVEARDYREDADTRVADEVSISVESVVSGQLTPRNRIRA